MIISPHNWIADLDPDSDFGVPSPASGYSKDALCTGGIAHAFRSALASTIAQFDFHLTTDRPVGIAAVFGARASSGSIAGVRVRQFDSWPRSFIESGPILGTIELNERGDGALYLPVPVAFETVYFEFVLEASAQITIGELWLGEAVALPRAYATRRDQITHHVVQNVSDAQTVRSAQISDYTRRFELGFDRLTDAERDALVDVWQQARGAASDVVVLVDDDESNPIFGRFQAAMSWGVDYPVNTGLALELVEGGRMLGA